MTVDVPKGKYVIAVSGGVDSMVLLDLLAVKPGIELIVAHFDHGIRENSFKDEKLVSKTAKNHSLSYEHGQGNLGANASEEAARNARYDFLYRVREKHQAKSVITAHHQGDLIETALINLLRGTGSRGLHSMIENQLVLRPMLNNTKKQILDYAANNNIEWHEDATNSDEKYLRNYIRKNIIPKLSDQDEQELLNLINKNLASYKEIKLLVDEINNLLLKDDNTLDRQAFVALPVDVEGELMINWLRNFGVQDIDRQTIERLIVKIKTAKAGTKHNIKKNVHLQLTANSAQISNTL